MEKPKDGITIYTKSNCYYCEEIKKILPDAHYINCDIYLEDTDAFLDFIDTITDQKPTSFPMVFKDKCYIGGYNAIKNMQFTLDADF